MKTIKEGDVFTIPIDEQGIGYGQIVKSKAHNFLMIVFKGIWKVDDKSSLDKIIKSEILFMGYSIDAKFFHNHWIVVGNITGNLKSIELPYYRLGTPPGEIFILNHSGEKLRSCSIDEFEKLKYQTVIAPVRYEKALKAFHGKEQWTRDYEELKIENHLFGKREIG